MVGQASRVQPAEVAEAEAHAGGAGARPAVHRPGRVEAGQREPWLCLVRSLGLQRAGLMGRRRRGEPRWNKERGRGPGWGGADAGLGMWVLLCLPSALLVLWGGRGATWTRLQRCSKHLVAFAACRLPRAGATALPQLRGRTHLRALFPQENQTESGGIPPAKLPGQ